MTRSLPRSPAHQRLSRAIVRRAQGRDSRRRSSGCERWQASILRRVISEIDIWRAANLMLKRYGETALEESAKRADELAADGDHDGAVTWRRITDAVGHLANTTPPGPVH